MFWRKYCSVHKTEKNQTHQSSHWQHEVLGDNGVIPSKLRNNIILTQNLMSKLAIKCKSEGNRLFAEALFNKSYR